MTTANNESPDHWEPQYRGDLVVAMFLAAVSGAIVGALGMAAVIGVWR